MICDADQDNNGEIDFEEFLDLMAKKMEDTNHEEEFVESFKTFDRDGNGLISTCDMMNTLLKMGVPVGESEIKAMLASAD